MTDALRDLRAFYSVPHHDTRILPLYCRAWPAAISSSATLFPFDVLDVGIVAPAVFVGLEFSDRNHRAPW